MKKLILLSVAIFLLQSNMLAQAPDTMWTKTFGTADYEVGSSVQQTTDGGYVITGYTGSFGAGDIDVWLIKTDSSGNTVWMKTFGGSSSDVGSSVQQTTDGGYIVAGYTHSFVGGDEVVYLIKTDSHGDTLWTKIHGGGNGWAGNSVQQTIDGGYIIAGRSGFALFNSDVYLLKTDSHGDTLWTKTFGGDRSDDGNSVQQTSDGGYIVAGYTDFFNVYLIKTDSHGDTLWTKTCGGGVGNSVQQTSDGGYIVAGYTESYDAGNKDWDVLLIKTDDSGNTLWTKTFGGNNYDIGSSVQQTTDGGYVITGYTESFGAGNRDVWLIKLAPESPSDIRSYNNQIPSNYCISQNYPNPFNPTTTIKYSIPKLSFVTIKIYDVLGNEVATLVNEEKTVGTYELSWDAENLPSGVYFYQLKADSYVETKKMILVK